MPSAQIAETRRAMAGDCKYTNSKRRKKQCRMHKKKTIKVLEREETYHEFLDVGEAVSLALCMVVFLVNKLYTPSQPFSIRK